MILPAGGVPLILETCYRYALKIGWGHCELDVPHRDLEGVSPDLTLTGSTEGGRVARLDSVLAWRHQQVTHRTVPKHCPGRKSGAILCCPSKVGHPRVT